MCKEVFFYHDNFIALHNVRRDPHGYIKYSHMGFFDFFKQSNINQGIEEYKRTAGAVLLDVRTPQEYQEGHIPESKNVPLQQLDNIVSVAKNKDIPLFVYCYSGSRSRQATGMLQRMGYSKVNNIGGIAAYSGKVEK